jgi:hypothetical protein
MYGQSLRLPKSHTAITRTAYMGQPQGLPVQKAHFLKIYFTYVNKG